MDLSRDVRTLGWTQRSAAASVMLAMEDYRRQVGARIRALREAKGLTQDQLGDLVGVREKTISRWENGRHAGYISNVKALADALDVGVTDITGTPPAPLGLSENGHEQTQLDRIEQMLLALAIHVGLEPAEIFSGKAEREALANAFAYSPAQERRGAREDRAGGG